MFLRPSRLTGRSLGVAPVLALVLALQPAAGWAGEALSWFLAGRPTAGADRAVAVLEDATSQGLDPRDYEAATLRRTLARAQQQELTAQEQASLDTALTSAVRRYLTDLRWGRVDPREIHAKFDLPRRDTAEPQTLLNEALAANRVAEMLRESEPRVPMYASLRQALAQYRALSDHSAWNTKLSLRGRKLSPGQPFPDLAVLAQRLQALGDLPAGTAVPQRFEGALVTALKAFQERHGIAADGVLGQATLQQLNVTPAVRVRQIELSLERLRWTPLLQGPRMIVVNVPEFVLRAYEVEGSQVKVRLSMKVIVGKALDTHTPLIDEAMRFIEFSPYWNVPPSIARNELIPKLRSDPAHFQQQGFEFVSDSGRAVRSLSGDALDAVLAGSWRIRQRPGPKNALGDIKFVFPNNDNVYLHHTATPKLFERERRDFSHGCIRVEQPVELAKFVLQDNPDWPESRIREAMAKGTSNTVALKQPVPVLIAYSTVVVKEGRVFFFSDLYDHDQLLDQALQARSASLPPLIRQASAPK